jgi:translation initiation factor 4G
LSRGFRGAVKDAATAAAVTQASEDEVVKAANDNNGDRESVLYSDEY